MTDRELGNLTAGISIAAMILLVSIAILIAGLNEQEKRVTHWKQRYYTLYSSISVKTGDRAPMPIEMPAIWRNNVYREYPPRFY